jgi:hypothetical protein
MQKSECVSLKDFLPAAASAFVPTAYDLRQAPYGLVAWLCR